MQKVDIIYEEIILSLNPKLCQILEDINTETKEINLILENQLISEGLLDFDKLKEKVGNILSKVVDGLKQAASSRRKSFCSFY